MTDVFSSFPPCDRHRTALALATTRDGRFVSFAAVTVKEDAVNVPAPSFMIRNGAQPS